MLEIQKTTLVPALLCILGRGVVIKLTYIFCRLINNMLIRDPRSRATLHDIKEHEWLSSTLENGVECEYTALINSEQLSEAEQAHIVQKMVAGAIATKEEIIQYV